MAESEEKYLSGAQAAEFLGVKPATLYAYASRGLIESVPGETGRERTYRLSELLRLRNSARGVRSPKDEIPVWTGPMIKSSITEIAHDGHRYRGENAFELVRKKQAFELVAELLWETGVDSCRPWLESEPFSLPKYLKKAATPDADYLDLLKLLLVSVEMMEPLNRKLLSNDLFVAARRLVVSMALTAGLAKQDELRLSSSQFPLAQTLLFGLSGEKSKQQAELVNSALVLCADHELNASALAARVAASCDASLYSCLLSALGTFSGTMHGAASRRAEDIVSSSMRFNSASAWLKDYLRHADKIPGFGTDLYEGGDPRARYLIEACRNLSAKNKSLDRLVEVVDCVKEHLGDGPNLDVGLAAVSYALALPGGSGSTIFAVSRTAGWIAHAVEQRSYGGLIRPRARYIGKSLSEP